MSQANVIFNFKDKKIIIECLTTEKFINICERFASQINENISKFDFKYNGNLINKELKYEELVNEKDKNSMKIIVEETKINTNNTIKDEIINNCIIGEIRIKEENINKDIRIINSFEEYKRKYYVEDDEDDNEYENEEEIKEKIIIKINNNKIEFNYYYNLWKKVNMKLNIYLKKI